MQQVILSSDSTLITDAYLRTHYDHRSSLQKVIDLVVSVARQVQYWVILSYHRIHGNPQTCSQKIEWKKKNAGLVVFLHGLRGDPATWHQHISYLQKHRHIDVFAPVVPQRGMCSLKEAANPVLSQLLDYSKENPDKPICLVGVSNGSRIATWLELKLREKIPQTPVRVSTIAGVHFGSSRMQLLESLGLAKWFYPKSLRQELQYGSDYAKALLEKVNTPLPPNCVRSFEFFATTEDQSVPDLDSSLPKVIHENTCYILHGHSHDSIVAAVTHRQMTACVEWMNAI